VTLSNIDYENTDDLPPEINPGAYVILEVNHDSPPKKVKNLVDPVKSG
jgi:hypothetical protein